MAEEANGPPSGGPAGLEVGPAQAGATLAALARALAPGTSWRTARELCRQGRVLVDGAAVTDPAWRPPAGSRLALVDRTSGDGRAAAARPRWPGGIPPRDLPGGCGARTSAAVAPDVEVGPAPHAATPASLIVHADADLVVVRKPAGVLSVPFARGDRDTLLALTRVALRRLEARQRDRQGGLAGAGGLAGGPTLRAVQRLDKETSGLVVFARSVSAQRALQQQLARRAVRRGYLAIAHGAAQEAIFDTLLLEDRGDGLRGSWGVLRAARGSPPPGARQAVTRVWVLERLRGATLLRCELETGRQHQIRIHLAEAGHPLVGETVYVRDYLRQGGSLLAAPRPMLHAGTLGFCHPRAGRELLFEEAPPADFKAVLERLRRRS
ncbi:MAG TPA: pseudouridine synthase [Thermoanaerobaculia bacterium]|nr:pseudouridine synthase [Thermoanaerobaculia bacterium]